MSVNGDQMEDITAFTGENAMRCSQPPQLCQCSSALNYITCFDFKLTSPALSKQGKLDFLNPPQPSSPTPHIANVAQPKPAVPQDRLICSFASVPFSWPVGSPATLIPLYISDNKSPSEPHYSSPKSLLSKVNGYNIEQAPG
ncbi:protein FAM178A [Platysternon megacephalum]|uniref:Protein FAM178A n=1 Tax=Platysternon megacephalum TaxID=55544 RepID=A0A4D9EAZ3_9SAUR|nr:protein FAM178A [Platysternon megacephalum]